MGRLSTVLFDGCTGGRGVACRETIWPRAGANFLDAAETQASMRDVQTVRSPFPQRCRVTYLNLVAECKVIGAPNSGLEGGGPALVRFGREQSGLDAILPTLVVWLAQVAVFLSAQDGSIHRRNREVVYPAPLAPTGVPYGNIFRAGRHSSDPGFRFAPPMGYDPAPLRG